MENTGKRKTEGSVTALDPVCGMKVDPATAKNSLEHAGKKYYFCCPHCLEKFRAEPAKYLKTAGNTASSGLVTLGMAGVGSKSAESAPVEPKDVQTKTKDPVCGMNVEPATAKYKLELAGKVYYFCSAGCLEKFRGNPDKYLATASKSQPTSAHVMHIVPVKPPDAKAPATQCLTCWSSSWKASDSSAVLTAEIWVRMSMQ